MSFSFYTLMRLTVIVTDIFYFFTLVALFKYARSLSKSLDMRDFYNMKFFGLWLFDGALLAIDNSSFQYNSMIFALILWTTLFILQKRYLLGAFIYCVAVLTKQISIYYSAAYVGYLLIHYVLVGKQIYWLRLIKLACIVIGSICVVFLPFMGNISKVIHQIIGGRNDPVGYGPLPTVQMIYAFSRYGLQF